MVKNEKEMERNKHFNFLFETLLYHKNNESFHKLCKFLFKLYINSIKRFNTTQSIHVFRILALILLISSR